MQQKWKSVKKRDNFRLWGILKSIWCDFHQLRMHYWVFLFSSPLIAPFLSLKVKVKERLISICTLIHLSGQVSSRGTHIFMSHQYLPRCVTFVFWGCLMPTFIGAFQYLTFAALKTENLRPCCKNSFSKRCVSNNSPPEQNGCPSMVVSHSAWFFCVENKREFERWVECESGPLSFYEIILTVLSSMSDNETVSFNEQKECSILFHFFLMHNLCMAHLLITMKCCTWKSGL